MIHTIASSMGVIFDPAFTMKVFRGMTCEMEKNPDRFKGRRVLFIHTGTLCLFYFNHIYLCCFTGGLYGITSDGRLEQTLLQKENEVIKLSDIIKF